MQMADAMHIETEQKIFSITVSGTLTDIQKSVCWHFATTEWPVAKTIKESRARLGAQLTICAQK